MREAKRTSEATASNLESSPSDLEPWAETLGMLVGRKTSPAQNCRDGPQRFVGINHGDEVRLILPVIGLAELNADAPQNIRGRHLTEFIGEITKCYSDFIRYLSCANL
jgi:hypothetical protein